MELIEQLNAALTHIATHVGATCCGVDVDDNDLGHTATSIITKINDIINERDFLKIALDTSIEQSDYFENERDKLQLILDKYNIIKELSYK
jgi:hypothetical protein